MIYTIEYSPESINSLDKITEYLFEKSDTAPFTVLYNIKEKIEKLVFFPRIGKIAENRPRLRQIIAGNYVVYYEIFEGKRLIMIADIVHSARQSKIDQIQRKDSR